MLKLHRLYAILDAETCTRRAFSTQQVAEAWRDAGIRLLQYRNKPGVDAEILAAAETLQTIFRDTDATLILNDRLHLLVKTGFHGIHLGQTDGHLDRARQIIGPASILGVSTHNPAQLNDAASSEATYVAIGPVFPTGTKLDADPVVGLEGVRIARAATPKPLVAIGGVTHKNAPEMLRAGADAVAVISGLLPPAGALYRQLRQAAEDFLVAVN